MVVQEEESSLTRRTHGLTVDIQSACLAASNRAVLTSFICVKGKSSRALSNTCRLCDVIRTWENLESCVDVGSIALADTVSGNFIVVESIFAVIAFSCGQLEVP